MATENPATEACQTKQEDLPCPNHYIHPFNFPELRVGTGSNEQPYFRAMIFFHKKPGLTDEFFHEHWKSVHADLTMQVEDAGVLFSRYVQFHQNNNASKAIAPLLESGGMQLVPFDGAAEFYCKDGESFVNFMNNVYNAKHLVGCGTRFVDTTIPYQVMVGYDNLIFGNAIESSGGKDGILKGDARLNSSAAAETKPDTEAATSEKAEAGEAVIAAGEVAPELKAPLETVNEVDVTDDTPCH